MSWLRWNLAPFMTWVAACLLIQQDQDTLAVVLVLVVILYALRDLARRMEGMTRDQPDER